MCEGYAENRMKDRIAKLRKVRVTSDYRKYFPDLNFDPSEQLQYIEAMVEKLRKEESAEEEELRSIEEDKEKYKNDDNEIWILESFENHLGWINMRHEELRANIQIAMLAPAMEGLYKKTLYNLLGEKFGETGQNKRFNSKKGFKGGKGSGAVNRIMQSFEDLGVESYFPADTKKILSALFEYRNALFHNGLEWRKEDCDKFSNEKHTAGWFTSHNNSCGPFFILPTRIFIDKLMDFFEDSINGFAKSKQGLSESCTKGY